MNKEITISKCCGCKAELKEFSILGKYYYCCSRCLRFCTPIFLSKDNELKYKIKKWLKSKLKRLNKLISSY